ncbi:MAG: hypothetical protein KF760_07390 [Candidatus Eremiobacteraeota bacterium]|nr:hypothetical protein [Candidatus Eremiobacteraeota bacterium]MCW5870831.1 hypothetical protein [Candidatus Eremiobacteraeota bacterium]
MRKRTEMGEMDAVRRIPTVKGKDYNPRQNAYRLALAQDLWAEARAARLDAQRKRTPTNPANRKPLNVQLFVTRYRSSVRQWPQIESLIERLNELFAAPQIVFQLIEPAECNRSVSFAQRCPFAADLDHDYEWIHLGVVPRLPEELPVLTSCGRCCLISDRSRDQDIARALAQLLGLEPGSDLPFAEPQIQWLRWQAFLLQGQPVPLPLVSVPVWVYPVVTPDEFHSQRSLEQIRQLLERINLIWLQAGLSLELAGCCPLQREDLGEEGWEQAITPDVEPLLPLLRYAPHCLHLPMIRAVPVPWSCFAFPEQRLAIVRDGITALSAAQALGRLLGLTEVPGADQLMSGGEGNRLSSDEVRRARRRALELTGLAEDAPLDEVTRQARRQWLAPARPLQRTIEFQLLLLRGPDTAARQSLPQAQEWVEEAAAVWAQAGLGLRAHLSEVQVSQAAVEAAYPNPGGARKPSCAGLTKLPGYAAGGYNLCVLQHLPVHNKPEQFQAYLNWPGPRLTLLAEDYAAHGRVKQLALALGVAWGVKPGSGSFERLLTRASQGLRLEEADLALVLTALAGPSFQPAAQPMVRSAGGQKLVLPIKLRRVRNAGNGCALSQEEATARILQHSFWEQANIQPTFVECDEVEVSDSALQESYPAPSRIPFNFGLLRLGGQHPLALNLLLVEAIPGGLASSFPLSKMVLADVRGASAGMAQLLGVNLNLPLTSQSLEAARAALIKLFPAPLSGAP